MTVATLVLAAGHVLGVNIRPGEAADVPQIAEAGFGAVRTDLFWNEVEREKGRYDFSGYDALLAALKRHGLTPVLILDYGNPHYDGGDAPRTDDGRRAFARFASAAAALRRPGGHLGGLERAQRPLGLAAFAEPRGLRPTRAGDRRRHQGGRSQRRGGRAEHRRL